ncbi:MAG: phospholipase D family protein [Salinivirgaceae bacterium]
MAKFLTTTRTSSELESLIIEAKEELIIISPYIKISENFYYRLKDASLRGVEINIIYGKDNLAENEYEKILNIENLSLYYLHNLHAKCYLNENKAIVSSMNIYDYSMINNREMGILINNKVDRQVFNELREEVHSFFNASILQKASPKLEANYRRNTNQMSRNQNNGTCIRCGTKIEFDTERPFCINCFKSWISFENAYYPENYCHICGKNFKTSFAHPVCNKC